MTRIGFPHSGISGSKAACASPKHFVAYHALLRLLPPRHPPCALSSLTSIQSPFPARQAREAGIVSRRECLSYLGVSFRLIPLCSCQGPLHGRPVPPAKSYLSRRRGARQHRLCRFSRRRAASASATSPGLTRRFSSGSPPQAPWRLSAQAEGWWRRADSNRRPPACKADALPLSYAPGRPRLIWSGGRRSGRTTGALDLSERADQLSCVPDGLVGAGGVEPPTSALSGPRSNQLS